MTVLIATFNRAGRLSQTLSHFRDMETEGLAWQLIVVDNGSSDNTIEVLTEAARYLPLITLQKQERGKNRALNFGLPFARGNLLVFTDDDIIPDRRWLQELVRAAHCWPEHNVFAGATEPQFPPNTPAWVQSHPFGGVAFGRFEPDQPEGTIDRLALGANFAVRRAVAEQQRFSEGIGPLAGASYAMGSETDYLLRLQRAGHRTLYVPTARVRHIVEPQQTTVAWLLGRSFQFGRGLTRLGLANPPRPPFVYGIPLYLVPQGIKMVLRFHVSRILGRRRHFDTALEYEFLRGSLQELRQMAGGQDP